MNEKKIRSLFQQKYFPLLLDLKRHFNEHLYLSVISLEQKFIMLRVHSSHQIFLLLFFRPTTPLSGSIFSVVISPNDNFMTLFSAQVLIFLLFFDQKRRFYNLLFSRYFPFKKSWFRTKLAQIFISSVSDRKRHFHDLLFLLFLLN